MPNSRPLKIQVTQMQRNCVTFGSIVACLFAGAGQQGQQPKDDVAKHPNGQDHSKADCRADCRARRFCIGHGFVRNVCDDPKCAKGPQQHQQIEHDQQPFENEPKKAAFGFSDRVRALWAIVGFGRNNTFATGAGFLFQRLILWSWLNTPRFCHAGLPNTTCTAGGGFTYDV